MTVHHGDAVTPNAFEAQQLTGTEVHTAEDAVRACDAIHKMGPSTVVCLAFFCKNDQATRPSIAHLSSQPTESVNKLQSQSNHTCTL